jgi:hypothetical protein
VLSVVYLVLVFSFVAITAKNIVFNIILEKIRDFFLQC